MLVKSVRSLIIIWQTLCAGSYTIHRHHNVKTAIYSIYFSSFSTKETFLVENLCHENSLLAHFLLRCRATSDFLKPSKLKRRLARRLAAATSARWLPLVRVSLLPRPSLSLRSWPRPAAGPRRALPLRGARRGGAGQRLINQWVIKNQTHTGDQSGEEDGKWREPGGENGNCRGW